MPEKKKVDEEKKVLADIIEEMSKAADIGKSGSKQSIEEVIGPKLEEMSRSIEEKIKKIEETAQSSKISEEVLRKQISNLVKRSIDAKMEDLADKIKNLDKVSEIEERINELVNKLSSQAIQGRPSDVSQGLAAFGGQLNLEAEFQDIRRRIESLSKNLENLSKTVDYKITAIEDRLKELEKIPVMEEKYRELSEKLGPENVQKLKRIIFSADELVDEVIPEMINKRVRRKIEPLINSLKNAKAAINDLNNRVMRLRDDIKELYRFREIINEQKIERENMYKKFMEEEAKFLDGIEVLKANIKKKMEKDHERLRKEIDKIKENTSKRSIEAKVNDILESLLEPRIEDIETKLMILDEKTKDLDDVARKLDKKIDEMEAPENVKKWVEKTLRSFERDVSRDVERLHKEYSKITDIVSNINQRVNVLTTAVNNNTKKLSEHAESINRVIDLKDVFTSRAETLSSEINALEERIASERERISALEQMMRNQDAKIFKLGEFLNKLQRSVTDLEALKTDVRDLEEVIDGLDKKFSSIQAPENVRKWLEARVSELEKDINSDIQDMLNKISEIKQTIKDNQKTLSEIGVIKTRINELSKDLVGIDRRINLEFEKDSKKMEDISKQIAILQSDLSDLKKLYDSLENRMVSDKRALEETLNKSLKERDMLRKEIERQRNKIASLVNKLKV
ncbi:MAG: hypothetical protein DRP15_00130 [Candidatus Aenigmatarchaeota archaeon]|nr:MAG: hypothetical protein DRP15_00130 [Candidatus Aenigmarchaeota archaeon]